MQCNAENECENRMWQLGLTCEQFFFSELPFDKTMCAIEFQKIIAWFCMAKEIGFLSEGKKAFKMKNDRWKTTLLREAYFQEFSFVVPMTSFIKKFTIFLWTIRRTHHLLDNKVFQTKKCSKVCFFYFQNVSKASLRYKKRVLKLQFLSQSKLNEKGFHYLINSSCKSWKTRNKLVNSLETMSFKVL